MKNIESLNLTQKVNLLRLWRGNYYFNSSAHSAAYLNLQDSRKKWTLNARKVNLQECVIYHGPLSPSPKYFKCFSYIIQQGINGCIPMTNPKFIAHNFLVANLMAATLFIIIFSVL